ncbi:MAG: response regulator transcription factor [Chloroflexi bacterium]|nr:response regulator transcription factor [Chloroflexota bacterium]
MKVLVISDSAVVEDISFYLQLRWQNAIVISATDGSTGIEMLKAEAPDLVMADSCLPDMNGLDLLGKVRESSDVPLIIILGQEQQGTEGVRVLEAGADDYITKPFSPVDVLARVNALLRRAYAVGFRHDHPPLISGDLTVSLSTHEVLLSGKPVKLTPLEYDLLLEMVRNEGKVLAHRSLLEKLWGKECGEDSALLKKYIYRLRQKLGDDSRHPRLILSERGVGYKFARHS